MSVKRGRKQSKFIRYMKYPVRVLTRARDLYVQSLTGCGGHASYGNTMGCPTPQIPRAPKSFSVKSSPSNYKTAEEELKDLIRLASTGNLAGKIELELPRSKTSVPHGGGAAVVPRSQTVAFERIDEDKPYEFGGEEVVGLLGEVPRSTRFARSRRSVKLAFRRSQH